MAKNGFSMSNRIAVEEVTASKAIVRDDCGKVFAVDAGGAITLTLPLPADAEAGWNCSIIMSDGPAGDVEVASSINNVHVVGFGSDITTGADYPSTAGTAAGTITFGSGGTTEGDRVELVTDGSLWYAKVITAQQAAVTLATV